VINLAMRAGDVAGMALFIAESLAADGYNVVFMADVDWRPLTPTGSQPWYYYIYWQYRNESFSQNFAPRDSFASTSALGEVAIGQDLNTIFRFDNLWTYLAYRYFGTIYTPYTPRFWLPRIRYSDSESERPWPDGVYAQLDLVAELKATNIGPTPQSREQLDQAIASWSQTLPSSLKDRTILVLCRKSPFIVSRIPHESQITWRENFDGIEQRGRAAGFDAIQPCRDFSAADYVDTTHLSVTGAAKLADIISTEVQRLTAKQRVGAQ
jgi:hypothetical protein